MNENYNNIFGKLEHEFLSNELPKLKYDQNMLLK